MSSTPLPVPAPAFITSGWLNTPRPIELADLRGRVVVALAFQMLCPGCVAEALPQLQRVRESFPAEDVAVIGLHTVFEHHAAMTPVALKAFAHEYRLSIPIGIDRPAEREGDLPATMAAYRMRGTPTLLLIDRDGRLRRQVFGHASELRLGAEIARLMLEPAGAPAEAHLDRTGGPAATVGCDDGTCAAA